MPARLYVVGEVMTEDKDQGDDGMPYALGVQWRASGFNISTVANGRGTRNDCDSDDIFERDILQHRGPSRRPR